MSGGASPRYVAAHMLLPRYVHEVGVATMLDAINREDVDFFIPVWMQAGFRYTPALLMLDYADLQIGVVSLPMPRESPEAYAFAVVGRAGDPSYVRCFLLEQGTGVAAEIMKMLGQAPAEDAGEPTVLGEWVGTTHRNHGSGPPFTGDFVTDVTAFVQAVAAACQRG